MKKILLVIGVLLSTNILLKSADEPSLKKVKYSPIASQDSQDLVSNVKSLKVQSGLVAIKKLINLEDQDFDEKLNALPLDLRDYFTYLLNNPSIYSKLDRTFLHKAENEIQVKNLIKLGIDINKQDKFKNTALNCLYQNEKNKAATELLKYLKKDVPNDFGVSALRLAAITNPENFEKILQISPDFNVSKGPCSQINLFGYVCLKGSLDELKFLMSNNSINLDERNENGTSFFMSAIENKSLEIARYLLTNIRVTANHINQVNYTRSSALMFACQYQPELVKDLLENYKVTDAHINAVNNNGCTALMIACRYQPKAVKYLLESNKVTASHVNRIANDERTALMIACQSQPKAVEYLLKNNKITIEHINKIGINGWTALMLACQSQPKAVELLLANDKVIIEYINKVTHNGFTALMIACQSQPKAVELLLANNKITIEHINQVNNARCTALVIACYSCPKAVKYLLESNRINAEHINYTLHNGLTVLMIACRYQPKAVKYLLADKRVTYEYINYTLNNGITALMGACRYNPDLIEMLINAGADKTKVNNQNTKALDILDEYHPNFNPEIRKLLED